MCALDSTAGIRSREHRPHPRRLSSAALWLDPVVGPFGQLPAPLGQRQEWGLSSPHELSVRKHVQVDPKYLGGVLCEISVVGAGPALRSRASHRGWQPRQAVEVVPEAGPQRRAFGFSSPGLQASHGAGGRGGGMPGWGGAWGASSAGHLGPPQFSSRPHRLP